MNKKNNSKISILIVPHAKKVHRLGIPYWLPKVAILSFASLVLIGIIFISMTYRYQKSLKLDINEKSILISKLEGSNRNKELELTNLKRLNFELSKTSTDVEKKLTEIGILQRKLEKMAAIKSPSRGSPRNNYISLEDINQDEEMNIMIEVLDDKKLELEAFIEELQVQFEYLETVPDLMPTKGKLTSKFGNRSDPFTRRIQFHQGIDIANSRGTDILASARGTVSFAGYKGGYGRIIIINHGNEYETLYAHCSKLVVSKGTKVAKGDHIANVGNTGRSTGAHLHLEVIKNGVHQNPSNFVK